MASHSDQPRHCRLRLTRDDEVERGRDKQMIQMMQSPLQMERRQLFAMSQLSVLALLPNPAHGGSLLEDFGGSDPTKITQPKSDVDNYLVLKKGEKAIDPTLRACK
jgi:hypothetical protein